MPKQKDISIKESLKNPNLCKVRTITSFITLGKDNTQWEKIIFDAADFCNNLSEKIKKKGYTVQSLRMVTNPYGEYLDTSSSKAALRRMSILKRVLQSNKMPKTRIRFAIGEARNKQDLSVLPSLIKVQGDLANACINIPIDELGVPDNTLTLASAKIVKKISKSTPHGQGNFNFCVNYNCPSYIPYFPPSYHRSEQRSCFAIGFETPDLLVEALKCLGLHKNKVQKNHNETRKEAFAIMKSALQYHADFIVKLALDFSKNKSFTFLGIDSSAAPSKECTSLGELYHLLGVEYFGAAGTIETSAFLTRLFKSIKKVNLIGFSGLMLALTEDKGLALGTEKRQFDIRSLLMNSAVCGIGLDTVPIAGDTSVDKIASLMRDTGTLAFRLNKPLMVRLFPVPGLKAGDLTTFDSKDLCNCRVLDTY
ncbi:DUF711 family protein [Candidatus Woesearchaeota archaeon]|nr:DUF711 family protein [Candidatus Woesearchaeota archaeon]